MNRREFVGSAAAGAALLARGASVWAAGPKYDLVVKGGRVIDPSVRLDAQRDVAIAGGRIAAIEPSIAAEAAETLDARGKLVVPGLIDIHTHAARDKAGPPMCLADGVTGWIDAGSAGADNLEPAIAVAMGSVQPGRILLNIGRERGLITPTLFTMLVLMTLATTLMATPLFGLLYRPAASPAIDDDAAAVRGA